MADIAVPFADETDEMDAPPFGASIPLPQSGDLLTPSIALPGPPQPMTPADLPESERLRAIKRAKLNLEAANVEIERLKPTLEKVLVSTGLNIREGAVGAAKQALGNIARVYTDIVAPKEQHPVGSASWFVQQAIRNFGGPSLIGEINQLQNRNDPESFANLIREAGKDLSTEGTETFRRAGELTEGLGGGLPTNIAGFLGRTAGASAPALLAAPLGLPAASVAAGLQNFGNTISDFQSKFMELNPKLSEEEAFKKSILPAGVVGTVTGILTRSFGGLEKLVENVTRRGLTQAGIKQSIDEVLRSAALEMPEEFLDQLSQGIVEKAVVDPNKTWDSIFSEAAIAGLSALPTSLGTAGAITGTASGVAGTVKAIGEQVQASRIRRSIGDEGAAAIRRTIKTRFKPYGQVQDQETSGIPTIQRQPAQPGPEVQAQAGTTQRSSPGQTVQGAPTDVVSQAISDIYNRPQVAPPPLPGDRPRVATFAGYAFNNPNLPVYQIPGVRPGIMRTVTPETAKQLGFGLPESIPTFDEWNNNQQETLSAPPVEASAPQANPVISEGIPELQRRLPGMTLQQITQNWFKDPTIRQRATDFPGGWTRFMHSLGAMATTPEDVAALRRFAQESGAKVRELMAADRLDEAMALVGIQPPEAYEYATGVKLDGTPKWGTMEKLIPGYKPTVPDARYVSAKQIEEIETPADRAKVLVNRLLPDQFSEFIRSGKRTVKDALVWIINEKSTSPSVRSLATRLLEEGDADGLLVPIVFNNEAPNSRYQVHNDRIELRPDRTGQVREFIVMHEIIHAFTAKKVYPLVIKWPNAMRGDLYRQALETALADPGLNNDQKQLIKLYLKAADHYSYNRRNLRFILGDPIAMLEAGAFYGLGDIHEFLAEAFSNPEFQIYLDTIPMDESGKSLWTALVDFIRSILNLDKKEGTLLEAVMKAGAEMIKIQREQSGIYSGSTFAPQQLNAPPLLPPNLPETKIAAGAAAVGKLAEKVVVDREQAGAALEGLAYERKQYREANAKLKELHDLAMGRFTQMNPDANEEDADEIVISSPTKGITVEEDGTLSVDDSFVNMLSFFGIPHDPDNVRDLQAKVFIERSARRYNNLQKQIEVLERAVTYYQTLKVKKTEIAKVNKQVAALKKQAAKLAGITHDLSVEERAAEMTQAEEARPERIAKQKALGLPPVQDFFGREVGGWRAVQQKITEGIKFLNTVLAASTTPQQQLDATNKLAEWVNIPGDVMNALKGGRELTDEQKASVYSALAQIFEEFDLRRMEMRDMANARIPELKKKIREQLIKIADAKIDSGMAANVVEDVLATLDGETGRSGTLTSQKRQLQLKKDIEAIKSFALALSNNIDQNWQLFEWLINPTTMKPILPPGTTVGVGQNTFNMILDEVKDNPEFGSAILTLIEASNEKLSQLPVVGLSQIEKLVKKGDEASMLEAKIIASRMTKEANAKGSIADKQLRDLLRGLTEMEIEQRSLEEGVSMFSELAADPDFGAVRDHVGNSPYGLVEPMVPSNHVETTFKAFGGPGLPTHPDLVLNANQDQHFKSQWFQKVWQWYSKAQEYLDAYDTALTAHLANPANNPSPASLGFDLPKVRGLRDAVSRAVPGAFLELSLNSENKRWRVPWIARKLSKYTIFRQHDLIAKMVGGVTGTDLRNRMADFVNHYLIGQQIRDQFRDIPEKLHAALKSHPEFNMNIQLYREHWNEMAHWGRMFGSPLKAGFVLPRSGRVVTADDMRLIHRQRQYAELLRRKVTESNVTQGVRIKTPTRTLVRPGAFVGDEGMPRFLNRRADNFIEQVVAAYGEPAGTFTVATLTSPTDPIVRFWDQHPDLLIQHVLDINRVDRTMRIDPKMVQAETALMNQWMQSGTTPTVNSLADLVNQLLPHFNPTPGMNAQEQLVNMLAAELKQYRDAAKGIVNERNVQEAARHSQPEISFSADNEFTRPAAKLELPSVLYDYGALSPSEHLVMSSRANHERIVAYANAINRAVAEMRSRMNELGRTMTPADVAKHYGGNLKEMSEVMELLQKVQQDFKDAYDSGSFLRAPRGKINDTLGLLTSAVLALPSVGIRNLTAGQFEVYLMSRAMGNSGHWISLYNVIKNLTKTIVRTALQIGEGLVKGSNVGVALLTGTNRHLFENAVRSFADAITGGDYGKNAAKVANLGLDSREGFRQRLVRILQETSEFSNLEDAMTTWTVKGKKVGSTAAVPVKAIRALFDKVGVQQYDFAINATALTYAEWLVRRMKEVALAYGQARDGLGQFDPTNRAFDLKPHEWGKFLSDKENEDALAFFRLFAEQSMGPEGFQLERSMWNWYQAQKTNPAAPLLTDRQMEALQRKLLADFNASTPVNRPSGIPANPLVRNLLLLQGYVSDGVLKILNTTLGGIRDRAGFAKAAMKAPMIAMLALASIAIGLMQGAAGGAWEKFMRGRMTSLPSPIDRDFWTNWKRFAEGTVGLAASNFMYIGDLLLWLRGEIAGNRGFDPHMRIFAVSILQRLIDSIRGTWVTARGSQNFGLRSLVPMIDAAKAMTPFWYEVENWMGAGAGTLKQGERVERGEYSSQGLLPKKSGFSAPQYGPTTVSRRLLSDYVSKWAENRETNPAAAQSSLERAKVEIAKLEEFHYQQYISKGYNETDAREKAKRDTWNDYQEINPAVAALLGRRPTAGQHEAMMKALGGDRLRAAQNAEEFWKAGARMLFNREGYITREEGEALRSGPGVRQFNIPGIPKIKIPGVNLNLMRRVQAPAEPPAPVRRVRRGVARLALAPLRKVKAGRRAVRNYVLRRERKRKQSPSLARRGQQRSVVRRVQFTPYSFA